MYRDGALIGHTSYLRPSIGSIAVHGPSGLVCVVHNQDLAGGGLILRPAGRPDAAAFTAVANDVQPPTPSDVLASRELGEPRARET
jgi:hypothetical protein